MPYRGILQTAIPEKIGVAALVATIAHGYTAINSVFFLLIGFWFVDFFTGIACMVRSRIPYNRQQAITGFLKLILIPVIGICAAWIEALVQELPPHLNAGGRFVLAAYALVAVEELQSIGRNLVVFYPGMKPFWGKVVEIVKRGEEVEITETRSRIIVEDPRMHTRKERRKDDPGGRS